MRQSFLLLLVFLGLFFISCESDTEPAPVLDCSISGPNLTLVSSSDISSCGANDGKIEIAVTNASNLTINGTDFTGDLIENLSEGEYTIVATAENGCFENLLVTLVNSTSTIVVSNVDVSPSGCEANNGIISVAATGEGEIIYSLDNTIEQTESTFTNLAAGQYTLRLVDASGCEYSSLVNVKRGTSYESEILSVLTANCNITGCHNGDNGASRNFTDFSNVQSNATSIKSRTQSGNMPPNNSGLSLTSTQVDLIACWVDDGALNN